MVKTLTSFGKVGRYDTHWNECDPGELVGTFTKICSRNDDEWCDCGCRISFNGLETYRQTTQAVIITIDDWKLQNILHRFYDRLKQQKYDVEYHKKHIEYMHCQLSKYSEGQILMRDTFGYLENGKKIYNILLIPNGFDHSYIRRKDDEN